MKNPKILHRVYFDDMPPFRDPFGRYLKTWEKELPDYTIMHWNASNVDLNANEWVRRAAQAKAPVFLSEYFRWKALSEYGGMYLDADCEVINGAKLHRIIEETYQSSEYDTALGVEDYYNGHPTAQSIVARPDSPLVQFMMTMYDKYLSSPLWHWREARGLIGPQLISLYFMENGINRDNGMMCKLESPEVHARVKIYPQEYFSPKFEIDGQKLRYTENTCVYHLFANLNVNWDDTTRTQLRNNPLLFSEYIEFLQNKNRSNKPGLIKESKHVKILARIPEFTKAEVPKNTLKILHRIYFGFDGKPDSAIGYFQTWVDQMPNYAIKCWDSTNLPLDINDYVKDLVAAKDHAFLTDYFRWWVLREHGGVYLDADIEIVDGLALNQYIEELEASEDFDAFIGIDEKTGGWYTAHSVAAKRHSDITRFMCSVYEEMGPIRAWRKKAFYLWAPQLTALYFFTKGHHVDGMGTTPNLSSPVIHARVKIYPQEYFSPIAPTSENEGELFSINSLTELTCLCHHFACSWHDDKSPYASHASNQVERGNRLLKELVGVKRSKDKAISTEINSHTVSRTGGQPRAGLFRQILRKTFVSSAKIFPAAFSFIMRGDDARDRREWDLAIVEYKRALAINPTLDRVWVQLGHAQKESGDRESAETSYRRALLINDQNADSHLQLGHVLKLLGRREEANASYRKAQSIDPGNRDVQRELSAFRSF